MMTFLRWNNDVFFCLFVCLFAATHNLLVQQDVSSHQNGIAKQTKTYKVSIICRSFSLHKTQDPLRYLNQTKSPTILNSFWQRYIKSQEMALWLLSTVSFGWAIQSVFCNLATRLAGCGGEPVGGYYINCNSSHRHNHHHIVCLASLGHNFASLLGLRVRLNTQQYSLTSHTLHRERKGLVMLQLPSCRQGTQLSNLIAN